MIKEEMDVFQYNRKKSNFPHSKNICLYITGCPNKTLVVELERQFWTNLNVLDILFINFD